MGMEPEKKPAVQEQKIKNLELELNDLRQGLTVISDYYRDLEPVSRQQDAVEAVDETIARQQLDDDREFEGIWRFHEEMLIGDPEAHVPSKEMYDAFVRFCTRNGRIAVERNAFEFVFSRMENPTPEMYRGDWIGFRLRPAGD
ncbi:MAG: hypothetical protein GYA23_01350 [Methanomicrobiales archaeon]|nr:hypothetical protein [Methanomicrobiales archaeon]